MNGSQKHGIALGLAGTAMGISPNKVRSKEEGRRIGR
jgi:hypothetical protein